MSEQTVQEGLNLLFDIGIILAELEEEKAQAIEAVIPYEVKEHIRQIEGLERTANANYASVEAAIKDAVLELGFTVKGANNMMAVWSKEGKPSVSIRRKK